jgi:uncharacterized membrane protein YraQ (UPF0718 family)
MERGVREFLKKNGVHIGLALSFGAFVLVSSLLPFDHGVKAAGRFADLFIEFASCIPFIFILIGLFDVWFPKAIVERHIGRGSGLGGIFWVTLLAMLQAGPLYGAFPVAYMLWKKGSSPRNVFIYLGAFSTIKLPMLTFETGFLGLKFTLLRTLFSVPLFILIGFVMDVILKKGGFVMRDPKALNEKPADGTKERVSGPDGSAPEKKPPLD